MVCMFRRNVLRAHRKKIYKVLQPFLITIINNFIIIIINAYFNYNCIINS